MSATSTRLPQVFNHLLGGKEPGVLKPYIGPIYSGGLEVLNFATPQNVTFFSVTDGPNNLNKKDEVGAQIADNRHFYFESDLFPVKDLDRLTYLGVEYELYGTEPRYHGNFTYVYGRALHRAESTESSS